MRLQVFLRNKGLGSRRYCDQLVQNHGVSVNGRTVTTPTVRLKPGDRININNQLFIYKDQKADNIYLKYFKPAGIICSRRAQSNSKTVFDMLTGYKKYMDRLILGGRLDKPSRGLLLISTDGNFINQNTHPSRGHRKKYIVKTSFKINNKAVAKLSQGFSLQGIAYRPFNYKLSGPRKIIIYITEGKKHEVRQIIKAAGNRVTDLLRTAIGSYALADMAEGEIRQIKP